MAEIHTQIEARTLVKGRVVGEEDVVILGRVEGEVILSTTLYVEPSGVVIGEATADQVIIGGTFVGKVNAHTAVMVTESGRVIGEVTAPRIVVAEGAQLRADLTTEGESTAARPAVRVGAALPKSAVARGKSSVVGQALKPRPVSRDVVSAAPSRETAPAPAEVRVVEVVPDNTALDEDDGEES